MRPTILALDLEGTLISNAVSPIPRPELLSFLQFARDAFKEVVLFTTVPKPSALKIAALLASEGHVPQWFAEVRYIDWTGSTKNLLLVSPQLGEALLIDDHEPYVHPGQHALWVEAPLFASPYPAEDAGMRISQRRIEQRLSLLSSSRSEPPAPNHLS